MKLSPKAIKLLTRLVIGGISSAAIGQIIKAERQIEDEMEKRYAKKEPEETDDSEN